MDDLNYTTADALRAAEIMATAKPCNVEYTARILATVFPIDLIEGKMPEFYGIKLRQAIEKAGLTQAELSRRLGVPRSVLNRFVTGERKPNADMQNEIKEVLEVCHEID